MSRIWDRLEFGGDGAGTLTEGGVAVAEVIDRIEAGQGADLAARDLGIGPLDVIAALAAEALGPEGSAGPSLVQARPRRPKLAVAAGEPGLSALLPTAPRPARLALAAGLLQVLDFWEPSHEAAQQADDLGERSSAAYWHGIAHRREPDPGNAAYWFRRVGRHPAFADLAEAAAPILAGPGDGRAASPTRGGAWDPFAFIDLCTAARRDPELAAACGRVQRLEMLLLLDASLAAAGV